MATALLPSLSAAPAADPAGRAAQSATTPPLTKAQRHISLATVLALGIVCALDAGIIAALITPIRAELAIGDEAFGRVAAAFTAAAMLGAPFFGYLAGRFGRRRALIAGAILWSLASSGGALASGVAGLALWRGLTGFGEAAYQGLAPGWLSDLYDRRWRNFVFSLYMVRNKIGTAGSLAIGAWLAAHYDWRAAFLVSGVPGLAIAFLLLFLREPAPGASDGDAATAPKRLPLRDQLSVLRVRPYLLHLAALAFFYSGTATAQMWAPAFLHRHFGLSNQEASGFLAAVLLFTTPVGLIGGFLAGRFLSRFAWGLTSALAFSSLIAAAAFTIAYSSTDLHTTKLFIVIAVCAFGSTAGSLTTLLVEFVSPVLRSSAGSIGAFVSALVSGAIAPWLLGFLSDRYGLDFAIFVGPVAYMLAGLIWVFAAIALLQKPAFEGKTS